MSVHIGDGSLEIAGNVKAVKRSRPGAINTASYSVMSLFAAGEQGVWFDPSDFSTLFQDSAGLTPVTAVGQTVGLMFDKSGGLSLGPERLVNGDFSAGAASWATDEFKWMVDTGYYPRALVGVVDKDSYQKMLSSLLSSFERESEGHFSRCLEELRLAVVAPDEKEPV